MTYNYFCDKCQKAKEVSKAVRDYNRVETCECGAVMRKVFSSSAIKTSDGYKA